MGRIKLAKPEQKRKNQQWRVRCDVFNEAPTELCPMACMAYVILAVFVDALSFIDNSYSSKSGDVDKIITYLITRDISVFRCQNIDVDSFSDFEQVNLC